MELESFCEYAVGDTFSQNLGSEVARTHLICLPDRLQVAI